MDGVGLGVLRYPSHVLELVHPGSGAGGQRAPDVATPDHVLRGVSRRSFGALIPDRHPPFHVGDPATTRDLGVTALWLMPIQPSPSYHGYDITDYYNINADYGTLDDFKQFLAAAHQRGIKVIIDLVINHTSSQSPWFQAALNDSQSIYRNWYIFSDTEPDYNGPYGSPAWYPAADGTYYYAIFSSSMPDLNFRNSQVTGEADKIVKFWLQDIGIDGFRLDAVRHLIEEDQVQSNTAATHAWLQTFHSYYKGISPDAFTIGEVWDTASSAASYSADRREMDMTFNFEMADWVMNAVAHKSGKDAAAGISYTNNEFLKKNAAYASFLTNHDQDRVMSALGQDLAKAKTAAVIYLSGPGTPFIYYGEEIGMSGAKPDERIRTPMQWSDQTHAGFSSAEPWELINEDYPQFNVSGETGDPDSILSLYRDLIHLRQEHSALRSTNYLAIKADNDRVYVALRMDANETILILCNLDTKPVENLTLNLSSGLTPGTYQPRLLLGESSLAVLTVNAQGGFFTYQPLDSLPVGANLILQLQPSGQ